MTDVGNVWIYRIHAEGGFSMRTAWFGWILAASVVAGCGAPFDYSGEWRIGENAGCDPVGSDVASQPDFVISHLAGSKGYWASTGGQFAIRSREANPDDKGILTFVFLQKGASGFWNHSPTIEQKVSVRPEDDDHLWLTRWIVTYKDAETDAVQGSLDLLRPEQIQSSVATANGSIGRLRQVMLQDLRELTKVVTENGICMARAQKTENARGDE